MDFMLLGQQKGWEDFIVPVVVGAIYLLAHLYKGATADKKPQVPKKPPIPQAPRPSNRQEAPHVLMEAESQKARSSVLQKPTQREFDRLFGEVPNPVRPTPPPVPQRPPNQQRPQNRQQKKGGQRQPNQRIPKQEQQDNRPASSRHLHSQLERRHGGAVHSEIEKTHLTSAVDQRKQDKETSIDPATYLARESGDPILEAMIRDKQILRRAYMLGIVLGKPIALQDDNQR